MCDLDWKATDRATTEAEQRKTIDALVAALEVVRLRVSGNSVGESTVKQIDDALALARKGG